MIRNRLRNKIKKRKHNKIEDQDEDEDENVNENQKYSKNIATPKSKPTEYDILSDNTNNILDNKYKLIGYNNTIINIIKKYLYGIANHNKNSNIDILDKLKVSCGYSNEIIKKIKKYLTKNTISKNLEDEEYERISYMYLKFNEIIDNYNTFNFKKKIKGMYTDSKPTNIDSVKYILFRIMQLFSISKSRATLCIRGLGIYALPPPFSLLVYLKTIIQKKNITHIIDYGAGIGLWSSILNRFMNLDSTIISSDKNTNNVSIYAYEYIQVNKNASKFNLTHINNSIDLSKFPQSTLLLLMFPEQQIAETVIKNFKGNYLVFQGDDSLTKDSTFFKQIHKKWKIIKLFDPLARLANFISGIYILRRKILNI